MQNVIASWITPRQTHWGWWAFDLQIAQLFIPEQSGGEIGPSWSGNIFASALNLFYWREMTRQYIVRYVWFSEPSPPPVSVCFRGNANSSTASVLESSSADAGRKETAMSGAWFSVAYTSVTPLDPMELIRSKRGGSWASFLRVPTLTDPLAPERPLYKQIVGRTRGRGEAEGDNRLDWQTDRGPETARQQL